MRGAFAAFVNIATIQEAGGRDAELRQGKSVADTAVAEGLQYLIYSSATNCTKNTNGKLTKNWINDPVYIPGAFMQNFHDQTAPRPAGDGTYNVTSIHAPSTELPPIDIMHTGKWIAGVPAQPEQYVGKDLRAATAWYTCEVMARTMSQDHCFLPPHVGDYILQLHQDNRNYHYFGDKAHDRWGREWATQQATGKLKTFEEYLRKDPLKLE